MRSLKLQDGDLVFDSLGKLEFVDENEALIQSINLRLKTYKGELFYNDNYGRVKLKGKQNEQTILDFLKDALVDNEKIIDIRINKFSTDNYGVLSVDVFIYLNTDQIINTNFNI